MNHDSVAGIYGQEILCPGEQDIDTAFRPYPELIPLIFLDRKDLIRGQSVLPGKACKSVAGPVVPVQPASVGSYPDILKTILIKGTDIVAAQAFRVLRIMIVGLKTGRSDGP